MYRKSLFGKLTIGFVTLLWLIGAFALSPSVGQATPTSPDRLPGPPVILLLDPNVYAYRVPPPPEFSALHVQSATFNVQFLTAGQTDLLGQPCLDWPNDAKTAYLYAASIWASLIHSTVPIQIVACWADLGGGNVLGYGGTYDRYRNFPGARPDTWYVVSLANALYGSDLNGSDPEIFTTYNVNFDWYFGTDGNPPADRVDLVTVVAHEIAHGLGFGGSMNVSDGQGSWGLGTPPYPLIYDRFTEDAAGNALLNTSVYPNPSAALASALTSNNIWFDGPNANAANGGERVKLFAPSTWKRGSSYVHLDYDTYKGTRNALMIYAISSGVAIHDPGPVTRGILKDLGWQMGSPNLASSTKTVAPEQAAAGEVVTFTVRLVNSGGVYTTARLTDTLPTLLQLQGTPTASSGPAPVVNGQTLTWQGVVTQNTTVTITYAARLTETVVVINQAQIDDGLGNVYVPRAIVNGVKVFLPLTTRNYGP